MFDWQYFFDSRGIPYVTTGHNARRGVIGVACPLCGDDPSHHMGVSVSGTDWWHCWRDENNHRGKTPHRLIMAFLGCSYEEAARIVEEGSSGGGVTEDSFIAGALRIFGETTTGAVSAVLPELKFPEEFLPISKRGPSGRLALPYLINQRGYEDEEQALHLVKRYRLRFAVRGRFSHRIIIPIYFRDRLVNWTGRTVARNDGLRYRSLSTDPEKAKRSGLPVAPINIKETIFDYDEVRKGGAVLVLCEGPFDAMRIEMLGVPYDIHATCIYSKTVLPVQVAVLSSVVRKYDRLYSLFDTDAFSAGLGVPDYLGFESLQLPPGVKDPAELNRSQFCRLFKV